VVDLALLATDGWLAWWSHLDPNWFIVFLTLALFFVAYRQWRLNETALNLTRAIERAWVTVDSIEAFKLDPVLPERIRVWLKNTGRSPAINLRVNGCWLSVAGSGDLPIDYKCPDPTFSSMEFLGAGAEYFLDFAVTPRLVDDLPKIVSGELRLLIVGEATYADSFGRVHHTRFRRIRSNSGDWWSYKTGNEGD
jgi:hypothetical protein